ncbi:MAG: NADH-quinone oxidoreductase subunit NuoE [Proteobacteria bacterium]|nr:NADH-quinone oxidoreductase subunit NuoE [Pseudomonadota bacterium]
MCSVDLDVVTEIVGSRGRTVDQAIPILQEVQKRFRYVPREAIERLAAITDMTESQLYGVATFYSQFRLEPVGDTIIKVCHGTACHVGGAQGVTEALEKKLGVKSGETTVDRKFTLTSVACVGCCSLAPVLAVADGRTYGRLDMKKAVNIVEGLEGVSSAEPK